MGRVKINLSKFVLRLCGHAGSGHEIECILDTVGHGAILLRLSALGEPERPGVDPVNICKTARRKGAQKVQRSGSLGVGLEHLLGVRHPGFFGERKLVDDVSPVGRKFHPILHLGRSRARLGELASHPAHLHHGHLGPIGENHGHLQHDLERVADRVAVERGEALGTVAPLKEERFAPRSLPECVPQPPRLACEDKGRVTGELSFDGLKPCFIGVFGHLHAGLRAPPGLLPFAHWSTL